MQLSQKKEENLLCKPCFLPLSQLSQIEKGKYALARLGMARKSCSPYYFFAKIQ